MSSRVTEYEIRPAELFKGYLDLVAIDIGKFFTDSPREPMDCPTCDSPGELAFEKMGFAYRECMQCRSLWVSPRPTYEAFTAFYSDSPSSRYWSEVFYPAVEVVRREKLWRPKAFMVSEIAAAEAVPFENVIDIGGGHGVFAEEFRLINDCTVHVIEPSPESAAVCRAHGIAVIQSFLEEVDPGQLPPGRSLFTSFELFEHVHDPRQWLAAVAELMRPNDLLVLTTLSSLGLDIRTLWEASASVNPPHHINFLNPSAMSGLATRVGLEPVRVFTPGVLDLDIMRNNREKVQDRFWRSVIDTADDRELAEWQTLVSGAGRSSHMWAVLRKPLRDQQNR